MTEPQDFQESESLTPQEPSAPVEVAEEAGALPGEAAPELLRQQLEEASRKAEENWDKLLRVQAEMDNLRRRAERDLQNAHKFALERFAKELLPVADSLELGLLAANGDSPELARLREGGELTLKMFLGALEKFGIAPVNPIGQKFNPEQHQAMGMEPSAETEPNTVLKVFQKGWLLNERLIRPAMVVVAQAAPAVPESPRIDEQA
jgi:molecular chaperone GrpE